MSPAGRGGSRTAPTVAAHGDAPAADPSVIPAEAGIQEPADTNQPDATAASVVPAKTRPVPGVTTDDRNMTGDDFALTAGWGHFGSGEAVMPGQGKAVERAYTAKERDAFMNARPASTNAERDALSRHSGESRNPEALANAQSASANAAPDPEATMAVLGETTYDIYLNGRAYWQNVPANVWHYKLGGYQVLKKWLSYREQPVLGRPLKPEEVQHFTHTARRIGAILKLNLPNANSDRTI